MADETDKTKATKGAAETSTAPQDEPAPIPAGAFLTILIALYLIAFTALMVIAIVQFWPGPGPGTNERPDILFSPVNYLGFQLSLGAEVQMLLLVIFTGALGSLAHALRSLAWHVAKRDFERGWILYYILLPFTGATLAGIFYFVIRAGFFSPGATIGDTSPFGFVALGGLVGMFSDLAFNKLREVAGNLLTTAKDKDSAETKPAEKGKDDVEEDK